MVRFKLTVEYSGAPFSGWQRQAEAPSVQQVIEEALWKLTPDVPEHPVIAAAGRTDAGVHATGQVCHCDLPDGWQAFRVSEALNYHLKPHPVAIVAAESVASEFHARFDATRRHYFYRIINRRPPLALQAGLAWRVLHPLDVDAMAEAAALLVGHHDFTTYRSAQCQSRSPVKTLDRFDVTRCGDEIHFRLDARSFLHNQVRSLVGTIERVGSGKWSIDRPFSALKATDRSECGPVAPPEGLYLTKVDYPDGQGMVNSSAEISSSN